MFKTSIYDENRKIEQNFTCKGIFDDIVEKKIDEVLEYISLNGVNIRDDYRNTLLHYATNNEMFTILINAGCDVNAVNINGNTPAIIIACYNNYDIGEYCEDNILLNLSDINILNNNGYGVLHFAVFNNNYKLVKYLLKRKVDVNAGTYILDIYNTQVLNCKMLKLLSQHGLVVKSESLLYHTCTKDIYNLIKYGANPFFSPKIYINNYINNNSEEPILDYFIKLKDYDRYIDFLMNYKKLRYDNKIFINNILIKSDDVGDILCLIYEKYSCENYTKAMYEKMIDFYINTDMLYEAEQIIIKNNIIINITYEAFITNTLLGVFPEYQILYKQLENFKGDLYIEDNKVYRNIDACENVTIMSNTNEILETKTKNVIYKKEIHLNDAFLLNLCEKALSFEKYQDFEVKYKDFFSDVKNAIHWIGFLCKDMILKDAQEHFTSLT